MIRQTLCIALCFMGLSFTGFAQKRAIELKDIYGRNTFSAEGTRNFRFSRDGQHYYRFSPEGDLLRYALEGKQAPDTVLSVMRMARAGEKTLSLNGYQMNAGEDKIILQSNRKNLYRFSYTNIPWLYDIKKDVLRPLLNQPVRNVSFSPSGDKLAYCRDNNLYIYELEANREVQVTHDPADGPVFNGSSDWVYEETFGVVWGYKWSPDGAQIAFYRFDTSKAPRYTFPIYQPGDPLGERFSYVYYRPGEPISRVSIQVYDLLSGKIREVGPAGDDKREVYYPNIYWLKDARSLILYKEPRDQKSLEMLQVDTRTGSSRVLIQEEDPRYIDRANFPAFYSFSGGKRFIYMSEKDGWRHLYLYDIASGEARLLTPFKYDMERILGVDEKQDILYCIGAEDPRERQVMGISLKDGKARSLTQKPGWNAFAFNRDFSYYVHTFSDVNTPPKYTLHTREGKLLQVLEDNHKLQKVLDNTALSTPEFIQIPNRNGVELNAWLLFPPDYDASKKYPVLFANYGGPGSQKVLNRWGLVNPWYHYLSQQGIIVACVDNTGTGYRGTAFKKAIYGHLGILEIQDQMDAARWLAGAYPAMDARRFAYWGWSFGGFMSTMAITYGAEVFQTAIAVAPVTNWKYYQAGYAERHMGLLKNNKSGYERSSPMAYIDQMKGNLLLIHGTGDDNVHFRNSAVFSQALIQAGKTFDQHYYPDKDHAIAGTKTRFHLYRLMSQYLCDKLHPEQEHP